jgi:cupin fold WbuC family metalloprotein
MKIVGKKLFEELTTKASGSPRRRAHYNMHESTDEPIHRLCISAETDTYIRPHRHSAKGKWEFLFILKGAISVLLFDDGGVVKERLELEPAGDVCALEIPENTFHCFISQKPGTVAAEVKSGPYVPTPESDFGSWAPPEGDERVPEFLEKLRNVKPGDKPGI